MYLENLGYWNSDEESKLEITTKSEVLKAFAGAEKKLKPHWKEMFADVYHEMPDHIKWVPVNILWDWTKGKK